MRGMLSLEEPVRSNSAERFGNKVHDLRWGAHVSLRGMARKLGTSPAWISYLERGRRAPSWALVEGIIHFYSDLGVPAKDLSELKRLGRRLIIEKSFSF